MSKIKIKNFGPIKEGYQENDGWMDIGKVTVFIGNQGSGKSTAAKAISTLTWFEKAMNRDSLNPKEITFKKFSDFFEFNKIKSYFLPNTLLEYHGKKFHIICDAKNVTLNIREVNDDSYIVPKIVYVPAERSFLTTIPEANFVKGLPLNVFDYAKELNKAQKDLRNHRVTLPIIGYRYEYDLNKDISYILGSDHKLNLLEASSGFQSYIPLYLVSHNVANMLDAEEEVLRNSMNVNQVIRMENEISKLVLDNSITEGDRTRRIAVIKSKYFNKCFINIVEEPELSLFPTSQRQILYDLLIINNKRTANKLMFTTHSPYMINFLSIAIQAGSLKSKIKSNELLKKLNKIVPVDAALQPDDVVIYQLDEVTGTIKKLSTYEGIPSDKNFLNESLAEGNRLFDALLEIEEEL
jgi:predicted ATPase